MKLSVLIPTIGREKELVDTIQSLLSQSRLPDEIIILDQNQPPFASVEKFLAGIPIAKHVKIPVPGVAPNYNRLLKEATGDVVLYLDDDVIPERNLIEGHLRRYASNGSDLGGVAGRVEQAVGDIDPAGVRFVGRYHPWSGKLTARFNGTRAGSADFAQGANMSFRRGVLMGIRGFDEGFGGNGYFFETDGCLRLRLAGFRIEFCPEASLKHLMARSGGARIQDKAVHNYHYVRNAIRLYWRHSPRIGRPVFLLRMIAYSGAKAAYNANLKIFRAALRALWDGWRQDMAVQGGG